MGGSRQNNCSILEAVELIERLAGKTANYRCDDRSRIGDHIRWISDIRKFRDHYPGRELKYGLPEIVGDIIENSHWQRERSTSKI